MVQVPVAGASAAVVIFEIVWGFILPVAVFFVFLLPCFVLDDATAFLSILAMDCSSNTLFHD
jgi:hypothetical protein